MTDTTAGKKPLLSIRNLKQYFPVRGRRNTFVRANDGVSLDIYEGETLGVVGESGCGKSTLGRVLIQLYRQTDGETIYFGKKVDDIAPRYVLDIYNRLEKRVAETKALMEEAKKKEEEYALLEAEYNAAKDKDKLSARYFAKRNERNEATKIANSEYLTMVRLIGGFFEAKKEDYDSIAQALKANFYAARALYVLRNSILQTSVKAEEIKYKIENKAMGASTARYDKLIRKLEQMEGPELEKLMAEKEKAQAGIDAIRARYAGDEGFKRYESMRGEGIDLARLTYNEMRFLRKDLQLIFQDPYSSLNPRLSVGQIISEGAITHKMFVSNNERTQDYTMQIMENCGLAPYMIHRYPHQFSGGQRQRIGIARALSTQPKFVVCDEAVSALDVSIQSQIINLLKDLKEKENLTYMFISHDLSVVKYISDRIAVMYLGVIVELCSSEELFGNPLHPYTQALLSAIPTTNPEKGEMIVLEGDIPSPINPPPGCKFNTRCKDCMEICLSVAPDWREQRPGHFVACHKYDD
ncbi:MAG: ATP-binding cassette domain-containing protein [Defluviitaleaceae bacterium]|nr:ATP-binding cassette domain-containing protein [Defluviitaleaceae bacterium]MCL2239361.1 ATP-binding cassette domain-containing protein [Defluviitaleaceae bacterium]